MNRLKAFIAKARAAFLRESDATTILLSLTKVRVVHRPSGPLSRTDEPGIRTDGRVLIEADRITSVVPHGWGHTIVHYGQRDTELVAESVDEIEAMIERARK